MQTYKHNVYFKVIFQKIKKIHNDLKVLVTYLNCVHLKLNLWFKGNEFKQNNCIIIYINLLLIYMVIFIYLHYILLYIFNFRYLGVSF